MYNWIQRVIAFIMCIILLPIFVVISIIIKIESRGPIIFKQVRVGKDNKLFTMYKFRSMVIDTPNLPTDLLNNPNIYITKFGSILRKTSLDELPQLINIIKGEMVFVGPRPALDNQYDLINLRKKNGIEHLYPGITGWAQINGRDELEMEEKVKFDTIYAKKKSIIFDLKIVFITIFKVIKREGIVEGRQYENDIENK